MEKLSKIISPIFSWITLGLISVIAVLGILITHHTLVASFNTTYALNKQIENQEDLQNLVSDKLIDCSCEKTFKQSYPVIWSGKVIASFAGGEDIGVERFSKEFKYNKFYVDAQGKYNESLGSEIRVVGRLIGITCAYANSVFKECVGEVVADQITAFK
ncbi:MAG: hypothetical protein WAW11_02045 [Patescibacteria group bacterium]